MLDIRWSPPYTVKDGFTTKWRREWLIPRDKLSGFFAFWRGHRFRMMADGFTVKKNPNGDKWYLYETKTNVDLFKSVGGTTVQKSEEKFILPPYEMKDKSILRPWQLSASEKLIASLNHWGAAIDGSEMGVGKTFSSCGTMRELQLPFVIVCPKPVINQWMKVMKNYFHFDDQFKGIINYELLIRGRKDSSVASYVLKRETRRKHFVWKIPKKSVIIWDEAHRLKNWKTKASKSCIEAYKQGYKQLFLSGTLASSPLELRTIGTCVKLFNGGNDYYRWAYEHGVYKGTWGLEFNNSPSSLKKIHRYLFEERGVRLLRDIIPNFPETEIIVNAYDIDEENASKIRSIYDEMHKELKVLTDKSKTDDSEMAIRTRALQKAEMLKIPLMEEMINEGLELGMSIVVFLNYSDSIDALSKRFNTICIYDGRNENVRHVHIESFQANKEPLLITNIAAAREGLDLQDLDGTHPRLTLISPGYSVVKIKQALGRVNRENSKSKSIQRIIYIANTQEENVVDNVGQKLENLTLINNGKITDEDLKI